MYVDSEEDPSGTKGALGRAGAGVFVSPYELERHAEELVQLGDRLHEQVTAAEVQPLRLGTSLPALFFAARIARLAGPEGTPGLLRDWADGLNRLGDETRSALTVYRATDEEHENEFRGLGGAR